MNRSLFIIVLLQIFCGFGIRAEKGGLSGRLDTYLEVQLERFRIPDLDIIVLKNDSTVYTRSIGGQADPDIPHYIGSISKSLTAFGILLMVEEGNLSLDQKVTDILPDLHFNSYSDEVTVRTLLNHTSGISKKDGFRKLPSREELHRTSFKVRIDRKPGKKHQYSNINYSILGWIIEEVSASPYADYMQLAVFDPLEMTQTSASDRTAANVIDQYQYWFGYPVKKRHAGFHPSIIPAGFIRSSASDLANYLEVNLNKGYFKGEQILSADLMEIMHTAWNSGSYGYAMGWKSGSFNNRPVLQHLGSTATSYGGIFILPEDSTGIVLLTNSNSLTYTEGILEGVLQILTNGEPEPASLRELQVRRGAGLLLIALLIGYAYKIVRLFRTPLSTTGNAGRRLGFHVVILVLVIAAFPRIADIPFFKFVRVLPDLGTALLAILLLPIMFNLLKWILLERSGDK